MPEIINTARGTANINTDRIVVDMSNEISLLKPRVYPLTVLTKRLNKKSTHNYRFDWLEEDMMARWTAINNGGTAYTDATTDLVVDDASIIAVNDLIKSVATGEVMKVTAIDTGTNTITVIRGYGETSAHADSVANDVKLLVVGNAMMQGSGASAEKYNSTVPVYNYTQIFKTPFSVTNTLNAMKLYGGKELARLQRRKAVEHAMSIEYAFLFGERKLDTSGAQPVTTTGGVLRFLSGTDNVDTLDTSSVTDEKLQKQALDAWVERLFTYGSDRKVWLCSPSVITFVNKFAESKLELIQSDNDKTLGLDITRYRTPHGTLNIVHHPLLVEGYAGYSIALDMEELAYRPLTGRDTQLKTNIQNNDEDGRRDMYITEAGLELRQPKKHGIFIVK